MVVLGFRTRKTRSREEFNQNYEHCGSIIALHRSRNNHRTMPKTPTAFVPLLMTIAAPLLIYGTTLRKRGWGASVPHDEQHAKQRYCREEGAHSLDSMGPWHEHLSTCGSRYGKFHNKELYSYVPNTLCSWRVDLPMYIARLASTIVT